MEQQMQLRTAPVPRLTGEHVAAAYQAYVDKVNFNYDLANYEKMSPARRVFSRRPSDPMKGMSADELRLFVGDAFEGAHPELRQWFGGKEGPESLEVMADLSVGRNGELRSFVHTVNNETHFFHDEHLSFEDKSLSRREDLRLFREALDASGEERPGEGTRRRYEASLMDRGLDREEIDSRLDRWRGYIRNEESLRADMSAAGKKPASFRDGLDSLERNTGRLANVSRTHTATSADMERRMTGRPFFRAFHDRVDREMENLSRTLNKRVEPSRRAALVDDIKDYVSKRDARRMELHEMTAKIVNVDSRRVPAGEVLEHYVRGKQTLLEIRERSALHPEMVNDVMRESYKAYRESLCRQEDPEYGLGDAIAKEARKRNPSDLESIMSGMKTEYKLVVHHDYFEESYTDKFYGQFAERARECGYSPEEIMGKIGSDREKNSIAGSGINQKQVTSLCLDVDERLVDGLSRSVEQSYSSGMKTVGAYMGAGYGAFDPAAKALDGLDAMAERAAQATGTTSVKEEFLRRVESPERFSVSVETMRSLPVDVLRDDMIKVASDLSGSDKLGAFLRDTGVSFREGETIRSAFGRAAAQMYGKGGLDEATRVDTFRKRWSDSISAARKDTAKKRERKQVPSLKGPVKLKK